MIDIRLLKKDFDRLKEKLLSKNVSGSLIKQLKDCSDVLSLLKTEQEKLNAQRAFLSKKIGLAYNQNKQNEALELQKEMQKLKVTLNELILRINTVQDDFDGYLHQTPNPPDDSVPVGADEKANRILFESGMKPDFGFTPKNHWELAKDLGLVDFDLGPKITGTRFVVYTGLGAKLLRALGRYTLDVQVNKNNYFEYQLPVIVSKEALFNSAQLPKFGDDLFAVGNNKYLSPTAEVQLVNLHADSILDSKLLPLKMVANSLCFRKEAGAAGRDTRGLIRLHQFVKTELVVICRPEDADHQLELICEHAQAVLKGLKLPHRIIALCTGDLGFAAKKTYDIEVWLPADNRFREISSCSDTGDFQSRRAMIRHRPDNTVKSNYVALLNGSGVAVDRLFAAVLENGQQADGSVSVPEALQPYLDGLAKISKNPA